MKRKILARIFAILALVLIINSVSFSQNPPLPLPNPPNTENQNIPPLPIDINKYFSEAYAALAQSRTPTDYRVAILISDELSQSTTLLTPEIMGTVFPQAIWIPDLKTWDNARTDRDFDGLIIHASALSWLDSESVKQAYWHGTATIVLDMTFEARAKLLGDYVTFPIIDKPVDTQLWFGETPGTHFAVDSFWVLSPASPATYEQDVMLAARCELSRDREACQQIRTQTNTTMSTSGHGGTTSSYGVYSITTPEDVTMMLENLYALMLQVEFVLTKEQEIHATIARLMEEIASDQGE